MKTPSPVLEALARRYERSQAGRTGAANRDLLVLFEDLLAEAGEIQAAGHDGGHALDIG
jgi:hypothetical protein